MKIGLLINENYEYVIDLFNQHKDTGFVITMLIDRNSFAKDVEVLDNGMIQYSFTYFLENKSSFVDGIFIVTKQVGFVQNDCLELYKKGIKNIFIPYPIIIEQKKNFFKDYKDTFSSQYVYRPSFDKPFLFRVETHSVDRCNLNCNGCNNMMPIDCCDKVPSCDSFLNDIIQLHNLFENICIIGIQGGEPLLNIERTLEFAKIARKYFPLSDIRVLTNGLLVPKTPKYFFDELSKINVTIHLSIYPVTEKILDKIISKFKESNVNYYVAGGGKKEVFYKRLTLESDNDENYNNGNCISTNIHYLRDGFLWKCPSSALVKNLDYKFHTKLYNRYGGIDIHTLKNGWDIFYKLCEACYLCKNCSVKNRKSFEWSNDKKHTLSDWII